MLEDKSIVINMNCVDPLGRTAMLMAIDNENMEMLELLLENKVKQKKLGILNSSSRFCSLKDKIHKRDFAKYSISP